MADFIRPGGAFFVAEKGCFLAFFIVKRRLISRLFRAFGRCIFCAIIGRFEFGSSNLKNACVR
ncbi:hypothetical protein [Pseudomonas sp. GD03944]|uniref:hypothetical protein n=1 Tax=Pseudomonas sp. GD03944 TaxID=2975409 RepID=UPI00244A76A7|nr:hypothetical protein [Pseudomonas sp. GD03944]MDH1264789.1 hypothetical protein [Pseudomonas sp. GD03944]